MYLLKTPSIGNFAAFLDTCMDVMLGDVPKKIDKGKQLFIKIISETDELEC